MSKEELKEEKIARVKAIAALGLNEDEETTAANLQQIGQDVRYHLELKKELDDNNLG